MNGLVGVVFSVAVTIAQPQEKMLAAYASVNCPVPHAPYYRLESCSETLQRLETVYLPERTVAAVRFARSQARAYETQGHFLDSFLLYELVGDKNGMRRVALQTFQSPGSLLGENETDERTLLDFMLARSAAKPKKKHYAARGNALLAQFRYNGAFEAFAQTLDEKLLRSFAVKTERSAPGIANRAYAMIGDVAGVQRTGLLAVQSDTH